MDTQQSTGLLCIAVATLAIDNHRTELTVNRAGPFAWGDISLYQKTLFCSQNSAHFVRAVYAPKQPPKKISAQSDHFWRVAAIFTDRTNIQRKLGKKCLFFPKKIILAITCYRRHIFTHRLHGCPAIFLTFYQISIMAIFLSKKII